MCAETFEHQLYSMAGPTGQPRSFHAMVLAVAPARLHLCQVPRPGREAWSHTSISTPAAYFRKASKGEQQSLGRKVTGAAWPPLRVRLHAAPGYQRGARGGDPSGRDMQNRLDQGRLL